MKGKARGWLLWFLSGALASAVPLALYFLRYSHHYSEISTFYRGSLSDKQVVGVAFVEFDGRGFVEPVQWKVQLLSNSGERMTLYQKASVFQEKIPHQPKIEIIGHHIHIDDGEDQIDVDVQQSPKG